MQREEGFRGMKKIGSTHALCKVGFRDNSLFPVKAVHVLVYIAMSLELKR